MNSMEKQYPLILVFYLERELISNEEIMNIIAEQVNTAIAEREANAMAFFLPTDGNSRIECINPIQMEDTEMGRINQIIKDLTDNFDIGQSLDDVNLIKDSDD